ncbi:hypothetical protein SAMN05421538_102411 [Paracoccus isoporae]|uniref:Uncharacterized protein n=1 Tax=Paracoccus isoporae TaxID=591205 RepID=A0A1G6XIH6_9RHOB|nr:hypothetical protein [Paracoccus isoporae]SDD77852.1 hypothetical protein SAMN05421538_102411 [Paracoccus isoporae]
MTDNKLFRKLWIVAGLSALLVLVSFSLAIYNLAHVIAHSDGHSHEIGQLLGLAPDGLETPFGVYQSHLLMLPQPFSWALARLLHLETWLFALLLLPCAFILFSYGFERAIRDDEERAEEDSYL